MYPRHLARAAILACLLTAPAASALAQEQLAAGTTAGAEKAFMDTMAGQVLDILHSKTAFAEKKEKLRGLFMQAVDTDWIAKFVLGRSWKAATPEQKARYTTLYRTYLTESYLSKFDEDSGDSVKDIVIKGSKNVSKDTIKEQTEIVQNGDEPAVHVDYLLHQKDGQFKIIDINIEGVSLLATHRQEFNALTTDNGIEGVIQKLSQLTDAQ